MAEERSLQDVINDANSVLAGYNQGLGNVNALSSAVSIPAPVHSLVIPPPPPPPAPPPPLTFIPPPMPPVPPPPPIPAAPMPMQAHQMQSPVAAQAMSGPGGGFNYLPPAYNTPASMGNFRTPMMSAPMPHVNPGIGLAPATRMSPLLPFGAFQRAGIASPFMRPFESQLAHSTDLAQLANLSTQEGLNYGAGTLLGAFGATAGTGLGALGGAAIGAGITRNVGGAFTGADIGGALGGAILGPMIANNSTLRAATAQVFRPAIERNIDMARVMGTSRNFALQGQDLDISGRGLSMSAAKGVVEDFTQIAAASKGQFTRQDLTNIMQVSGEQGLLDMAQNRGQIVESVKTISGLIGTMAQITGDPDFKNNLRLMGELRRQGANVHEMKGIMQEVQQFGAAAGMSVQEVLATGGQQGAVAYQGMGLSRIQGTRMGAFSTGFGKQAVAAGAFNPALLDRLGGESGVSQRFMEMGGNFLANSEAMMPYLVREGKGGGLEIDQEKLRRFRRGDLSIDQLVSEGGANVSDPRILEKLVNSMGDLKDELAKSLGPQGSFVAMANQIKSVQEELGVSRQTAAQIVLGDKQQARQFEATMQSGAIGGMIQNYESEITKRRFEAEQAARAGRDSSTGFSGFMSDVGNLSVLGMPGRAYGAMNRSVDRWYSDRIESDRMASVGRQLVTRGTGREHLADQTSADVLRSLRGGNALSIGTTRSGTDDFIDAFTTSSAGASNYAAMGLGSFRGGSLRSIRGGISGGEADIINQYANERDFFTSPFQGATDALESVMSDRTGTVSRRYERQRNELLEMGTSSTAALERRAEGDTAIRKRLRGLFGITDKSSAAERKRVEAKIDDVLAKTGHTMRSEQGGSFFTNPFGDPTAVRRDDVSGALMGALRGQVSDEKLKEFQVGKDVVTETLTALAGTDVGEQTTTKRLELTSEAGKNLGAAQSVAEYEDSAAGMEAAYEKIEDLTGLDVDNREQRAALRILSKYKDDPDKALAIMLQAMATSRFWSDDKNQAAGALQRLVQRKNREKKGSGDELRKLAISTVSGLSDDVKAALVDAGLKMGVTDGLQASGDVKTFGRNKEDARRDYYKRIGRRITQVGGTDEALKKTENVAQINAAFAGTEMEDVVDKGMGGDEMMSAIVSKARSMDDDEFLALTEKLEEGGRSGVASLLKQFREDQSKTLSEKDKEKLAGGLANAGKGGSITPQVSATSTSGNVDISDLRQNIDELRQLQADNTEQFGQSVGNFGKSVSRLETTLSEENLRNMVKTLQE